MHTSRATTIFAIIVVLLIASGVGFFVYHSHKNEPGTLSQQSDNSKQKIDKQQKALACINAFSSEVKIGQKLMVASYSQTIGAQTPVLAEGHIGGIVIMNEISAAQINAFRIAMDVPPFVAVDQEGGTVQRYSAEGIVPGVKDMVAQYTPSQAYSTYLNDDTYLKSLGITTNFSPVLGVMSSEKSPLPGRMYSSDPKVVADYALESVRAAQAAGITPVIKHFPGLGSASGNTDYGSATTDSLNVLESRDLVPYKTLAGQHPDVMVGSSITPGLTDGQPAVWSPAAVKLLRSMGYQNAVVYSDSLTANAIPGTLADAVVKAWQAGIDVALIVQTEEQTPELQSDISKIVIAAKAALQSGALNNAEFTQSIQRILARKAVEPCSLT